MKFRFCECNFSSEPAGGAVSLCSLGHCSTCWFLPHQRLIAFQQRAALWFLCMKRPSWIIRAEYSGGLLLCGGSAYLLLYEWDRFSFKQSSILCFPDVTIPLFFFWEAILHPVIHSPSHGHAKWSSPVYFYDLPGPTGFQFISSCPLFVTMFLLQEVFDIFLLLLLFQWGKTRMLSSEATVEVVLCVCLCVSCFPPTVGMSSVAVCRHSSSVSPFTLSCVLSARDSLRLCPSVCVYVSVSRSSVTNKGFNGVLGSLAFPFSEATWPAITTLMIVFQSIPFHPIPSRCLFHLSLVVIVWVPSHSILLHHQNHLM